MERAESASVLHSSALSGGELSHLLFIDSCGRYGDSFPPPERIRGCESSVSDETGSEP